MTAIAAGLGQSLAVESDGTVWAWGGNDEGQLGIGEAAGSDRPVKVTGISGVTAVAASWRHALALESDGTVWAWGDNDAGVLGIGRSPGQSYRTPVEVAGLSDITAIATGGSHSLALQRGGTVWAWGDNQAGQLGIGTSTGPQTCRTSTLFGGARNIACSLTPVRVTGLSAVTAIGAGGSQSLAMTSDGTVWVWGDNEEGQLGTGNGTGPDRCGSSDTPSPCSVKPIHAADAAGAA